MVAAAIPQFGLRHGVTEIDRVGGNRVAEQGDQTRRGSARLLVRIAGWSWVPDSFLASSHADSRATARFYPSNPGRRKSDLQDTQAVELQCSAMCFLTTYRLRLGRRLILAVARPWRLHSPRQDRACDPSWEVCRPFPAVRRLCARSHIEV